METLFEKFNRVLGNTPVSVRDLALKHTDLFVEINKEEFNGQSSFRPFLDFFVEEEHLAILPYGRSTKTSLCSFLNADEITIVIKRLGVKNPKTFSRTYSSIYNYICRNSSIKASVYQKIGWSAARSKIQMHSLTALLDSIARLAANGQTNRKSIMKSFYATMVFHQNPDWRDSVLAAINSCFPKKTRTKKTNPRIKWTPEKVDAEIKLANQNFKNTSEFKKYMNPLYLYLFKKNRINEITFRNSAVKKVDKASSRNLALNLKNGEQIYNLAIKISNRHPSVSGLRPLLYALLKGKLANKAKFYFVPVELLMTLRDILEISSWADCQANFPALAELLTLRSMGKDARKLFPDAPSANLSVPKSDRLAEEKADPESDLPFAG